MSVDIQDALLVRDAESLVRLAAGGGRGLDPSTGFHAVLTMAFQCKRLTAFGFDGDATYDGHEITPEHPIAIEHVLLRLLQRGGAIAGLPRGWERTQLVMAPQVPPRDRVPVGKKGARH